MVRFHTKNVVKFSAILMIFSIAMTVTSCPGNETSDNFDSGTCEELARITVGEYWLDTNMWNKGSTTGQSQCIYINKTGDSVTYKWTWSWPYANLATSGKSYPAVQYGWWWWDETFTTSQLPIKISELTNVQAVYNVTTSASGMYNLAFQMWIGSQTIGYGHRFVIASVNRVFRDVTEGRFCAGRPGNWTRSRSQEKISCGAVPKNRSAAVVPSGRVR